MPNAADALLIGQKRLHVEHGETLTYRGSAVLATVDRSPEASPNSEYEMGDGDENEGTIEIKLSEIAALSDSSNPRPGETFTDASGVVMRVTHAKTLGAQGWELRYTARP
jgi:hypothetical protein